LPNRKLPLHAPKNDPKYQNLLNVLKNTQAETRTPQEKMLPISIATQLHHLSNAVLNPSNEENMHTGSKDETSSRLLKHVETNFLLLALY